MTKLKIPHHALIFISAMEQLVRGRKARSLVASPPRTLADLRQSFHLDVKSRIIAEIDKDLTKHPVGEIEKDLVVSDVVSLYHPASDCASPGPAGARCMSRCPVRNDAVTQPSSPGGV